MALASFSFAQARFMQSVVRLVAPNEYGEQDVGTGIIVGYSQQNWYVVTAHHVVAHAPEAELYYYQQEKPFKATVKQKDEALDVAVLEVKASSGFAPPRILPGDPTLLQIQQKVLSIGHPNGSFWKPNYLNIIQELSLYDNNKMMGTTPQSIVGGCSGGPVLTYEGIWLGLITETTNVEAKCVKIDALLKLLESWKVPLNLTKPKEPTMVSIPGGSYTLDKKSHSVKGYKLAKMEVSYEDFQLFVAATGYVTDAEREGYSWTFYNAYEGEAVLNETRTIFKNIFEDLRNEIDNKFNVSSSSQFSVGKALYDVFDYDQIGSYLTDPLKNFMYEVFDKYDYRIEDKELEEFVKKVQYRMRNEWPRDNIIKSAFDKIQYRINQKFEVSYSMSKAPEMENLKKILKEVFSFEKLRSIESQAYLDKLQDRWRYLDRTDWRHDALGISRKVSESDHPVLHVSFRDAQAYCTWLSEQTDKKYRLPTEEEWELAALNQRSNSKALPYETVIQQTNIRDISFGQASGWGSNKSYLDDGYAYTAPVSAQKADHLGLHHLLGNVSEWCVGEENKAVYKGGHFERGINTYASSSDRVDSDIFYKTIETTSYRDANFRAALVGFRVAMDK